VTTEGAIYYRGGIEGTGLPRSGSDPPDAFVPRRVAADPSLKSVTAGAGHVCGLPVSGAAYCWGANDSGELGTGSPSERELRTPPWGPSFEDQLAVFRFAPGKTVGAKSRESRALCRTGTVSVDLVVSHVKSK
jgi:alpha-tubulin suppressor-like RCC1 family protein